jgi:16S rRNA (cytosine1407-C5)-methyltransferase
VVLLTWGAANTAITNFTGEKIGAWFPETFDRVLLDALMQHGRPSRLRQSPIPSDNPRRAERLAARQLALLESAVSTAKIGAELCTRPARSPPKKTKLF